ncbi:MAG: glutamate 2,3-aminomutase [Clostridia bacterium]|nr:glutamate 2,3-aminomutase [Clostridia bacterium]
MLEKRIGTIGITERFFLGDSADARSKKRRIAEERAQELQSRIHDYLEAQKYIPTGFARAEATQRNRARILSVLGGTEEEWADWKWQMRNRIRSADVLGEILGLSEDEKQEIKEVGCQYRWAISPYYASLIDPEDPDSPIRQQAVPSIQEVRDRFGVEDPMAEEFTSPAPAVTRRYPDRLIINVTNCCAMFCRHCQRRRNIGEVDQHTPKADIQAALDYIRQHEEIRDVLITGGDALMLSDRALDWILGELDRIPHVEIKRLGTRVLVTLPQRVTPELCEVIAKHPPIYINTQFNHPREVTPEAAEACDRLLRAGAVLGNQAVLLKGINNHPYVMKKLNQELLRIRVRPYYIFHAKPVKGTSHFIPRVEDGIEIMENLRGYTSGLAIPTYIINAPGGYGKVPVIPQYLIDSSEDTVILRTWEGRIIEYPNPTT